jgi:hypothetical protein
MGGGHSSHRRSWPTRPAASAEGTTVDPTRTTWRVWSTIIELRFTEEGVNQDRSIRDVMWTTQKRRLRQPADPEPAKEPAKSATVMSYERGVCARSVLGRDNTCTLRVANGRIDGPTLCGSKIGSISTSGTARWTLPAMTDGSPIHCSGTFRGRVAQADAREPTASVLTTLWRHAG